MLTSLVLNCGAQLQNPPPRPDRRQPGGEPDDVWLQQQRKEMEKKANLQRQEEIKKDSEKLLELATELKQSVDKSSENTLSLDVIKKAEQIEKLAKTVKEKMKGP
jgi:hypothetical protein